jgi:serine/threonine protein kinase/Flp pilus assembly protein TadD
MSAHTSTEESVFKVAAEFPTAEERVAYLHQVCDGDKALFQRVSALLRAHEESQTFLESPPRMLAAAGDHSNVEVPSRIGPYKLREKIGEGGMGVVYVAEQTEPVRRKLALKIIKPGMGSRDVVARFEAERQALAMMDHPHIARVFDGGATEDGHPYFVMELVQGPPITDYCDQHKLNNRQRLEQFEKVCRAVQHAHQKGVIHRDLKPSNILMPEIDGRAVPKIIDFGVAKAVGHKLTEHTLYTQFSQMVGTPLYMSPEQAGLGVIDVDTRSDVYSIGVLLFELLTGNTPFDSETLKSAGFDEMRRIIREDEPPKPSAMVSTLKAEALSTISQRRGSDPRKLSESLAGELDWIVMKALEKDRSRRYETASRFAEDIEHYLRGEPVVACPPSAWYTFRKFAHRHRAGLATSAAVLVAIVASLSVSTVLIAQQRDAAQAAASEADRERHRAEENLLKAKQAVDTWFTKTALELAGQPHTAEIQRALLEQALEFYLGFLEQKSNDPAIRWETALAYWRVSYIYGQLGRHRESVEYATQAAQFFQSIAEDRRDDPEAQHWLAESYLHLGIQRFYSGELETAPDATSKALAIWEQLARDHPTNPEYLRKAARSHVAMANQLARFHSRLPEAESHCRESLRRWELFRAQFPDLPMQPWEEAHTHHWLASVLKKRERFGEVEHHLRVAMNLRTEMLARKPDALLSHQLAHVKAYLGAELLRQGSYDEAEQVLRSAIELSQPLVDDFPELHSYRKTLRTIYESLAQTLFCERRFEEAEQAARDAFALSRAGGGGVAVTQYNLALIVYHRGNVQEAADLFRNSIERYDRTASELPTESPERRRVLTVLHWMLTTCPLSQFHDPPRGLEIAKWLAQRDPELADSWAAMGIAQYRLGQFEAADQAFRKAIDLRGWADPYSCYFLSMSRSRQGDREDARHWYQKAIQIKEVTNGANSPDFLNFRMEAEELLGITSNESQGADRPDLRTDKSNDQENDDKE